jgi:uncharacterized phage-associated protein
MQLMIRNGGSFRKSGRYAAHMPSVHDVASYILHKQGRMSTWKLQKLVYYSQAWSLVWDDGEPLFADTIQAWANGPVCPDLYKLHKREFAVDKPWPKGDWRILTASQKGTIDAVLKYYGKHTGHWLRELTHREDPWKRARKGLPTGASSQAVITLASMALYYSSL